MGRLYDMVQRIDSIITERGLDAFKVKGEIGLEAGFFVSLVFEDSEDEPDKISALSSATRQVLGVEV